MNIAILYGGTAPEKHASAENALAVQKELLAQGHKAPLLPFNQNLVQTLAANRYDIAFIAVQGKKHGDGCCQSLCEWAGVPYTGARAVNAGIINDKSASKKICAWHDVVTPPFIEISAKEYQMQGASWAAEYIKNTIGYPVVVKPCNQGGSLGIALLENEKSCNLLANALAIDTHILVEKYVPGSFVTVGILEVNGQTLALPPLTASCPAKNGIQLFDNTFTVRPAQLPQNVKASLEQQALLVFKALGGRAYARVDFMLDAQLVPQFLEMNAVPGLRAKSFYPEAAKLAGYSLKQVCEYIVAREIPLCAN